MNNNFASFKGLGPGSLPYLRNIHKARKAETFLCNEQNLSRIRMSEQIFKQNKRFLRALPAGRTSHFKSRVYPSLLPCQVYKLEGRQFFCFIHFLLYVFRLLCLRFFNCRKDQSFLIFFYCPAPTRFSRQFVFSIRLSDYLGAWNRLHSLHWGQ